MSDGRALQDGLRQPIAVVGKLQLSWGSTELAETINFLVRFADAPLHWSMHHRLAIRLASVQGHDGVSEVVAHHATSVSRFGPLTRVEQLHALVEPLDALPRGAAPVVLTDMDDMILKVLEGIIRILGSFQIAGIVA